MPTDNFEDENVTYQEAKDKSKKWQEIADQKLKTEQDQAIKDTKEKFSQLDLDPYVVFATKKTTVTKDRPIKYWHPTDRTLTARVGGHQTKWITEWLNEGTSRSIKALETKPNYPKSIE